MVSSEQFIEKIEQILNYYNLSASLFAEKIGVQRSSLSHLLSGRNKPSLDFVIKIVEEFPEVDLYWFLFNKGEFPKEEIKKEILPSENRVFEKKNFENSNIVNLSREILPLDLFQNELVEEPEIEIPKSNKIIPEENFSSNNILEQTKKNEINSSYIKNEDIKESNLSINNSSNRNENLPIENLNHKKPKVKKIILIYDDGFFEEYNYR